MFPRGGDYYQKVSHKAGKGQRLCKSSFAIHPISFPKKIQLTAVFLPCLPGEEYSKDEQQSLPHVEGQRPVDWRHRLAPVDVRLRDRVRLYISLRNIKHNIGLTVQPTTYKLQFQPTMSRHVKKL